MLLHLFKILEIHLIDTTKLKKNKQQHELN